MCSVCKHYQSKYVDSVQARSAGPQHVRNLSSEVWHLPDPGEPLAAHRKCVEVDGRKHPVASRFFKWVKGNEEDKVSLFSSDLSCVYSYSSSSNMLQNTGWVQRAEWRSENWNPQDYTEYINYFLLEQKHFVFGRLTWALDRCSSTAAARFSSALCPVRLSARLFSIQFCQSSSESESDWTNRTVRTRHVYCNERIWKPNSAWWNNEKLATWNNGIKCEFSSVIYIDI